MVFALIGINTAVALFLQAQGQRAWEETLERFGHSRAAVWNGEYWRLFTSIFLHAGFVHLVPNMVVLYLIGRSVEAWLGPLRFLILYLVCGLSGVVFYQAFSGLGIGVGASGAVLGLLGFLLVLGVGRHGGDGVAFGRRFWLVMLVVVALLLADDWVAGWLFRSLGNQGLEVALSAHFGGFIAGVFAGYFYFSAPGKAGWKRRLRAGAAFLLLIGLLSAYGFAYPVFDWTWYLWRAERALEDGDADGAVAHLKRAARLGGTAAAVAAVQLEAAKGDPFKAEKLWEELEFEDPAAERLAGFYVYDAFAAEEGCEDEARAVLEELLAMADRALAEKRDPIVLNEAAWYRALLERDLETALEYAREAVAGARQAAFVNTLGWVEFLLGYYEGPGRGPAFEHLREAVELEASGPNLLYLALAWYHTGGKEEARRLAAEARRAGGFFRHEEKLLSWLEESLASG